MDFNFSWGYMYGIFFAFVGALLVLLRATGKADTKKKGTGCDTMAGLSVASGVWPVLLLGLLQGPCIIKQFCILFADFKV